MNLFRSSPVPECVHDWQPVHVVLWEPQHIDRGGFAGATRRCCDCGRFDTALLHLDPVTITPSTTQENP